MTSLASVPVEQLKPRTIVFAETRLGDKADSPAELIPFEEWLRDKPVQRRFLAMLPDFREPLLKEGGTAKLSMYVAEARFRDRRSRRRPSTSSAMPASRFSKGSIRR